MYRSIEIETKLAFMSLDQVEEPVTPVALRAPELVLGLAFDQSIDIWSFGYLLSELVTGTMVFEVDSCGEKTPENDAQTNDVHIMEFTDRLGAPLEYLLQKWPRRERYYGKDGTQTRWSVEPGEDLADKHPVCLLEDFILKERLPDISEGEQLW
jgi:serine/threonine protein kinase